MQQSRVINKYRLSIKIQRSQIRLRMQLFIFKNNLLLLNRNKKMPLQMKNNSHHQQEQLAGLFGKKTADLLESFSLSPQR